MRLSLADALFYALMVGAGEVYFLANAVRLGPSYPHWSDNSHDPFI